MCHSHKAFVEGFLGKSGCDSGQKPFARHICCYGSEYRQVWSILLTRVVSELFGAVSKAVFAGNITSVRG